MSEIEIDQTALEEGIVALVELQTELDTLSFNPIERVGGGLVPEELALVESAYDDARDALGLLLSNSVACFKGFRAYGSVDGAIADSFSQ